MAKEDFDRSKFKGATVAANKASAKEAEKATAFQGGRAGYITIKDGKTILRIAPPHSADSPALEPICKAWLPQNVDGAIKNMPIFNARVHSPISKDIVDEYVNFLSKLTYSELPKDEAKKKLAPVSGYKDKNGKWISGIRPNLGFVGYAWCGDEFGRVELNKTVVDRMNELAMDEEVDEAISTDPFSDPDTGVSLIIEFDKSAESNKKWKVGRGSKPRPLSNEQLMELDKAESIASMVRNAYTKEDYDRALDGLRIFDEKHGYGIMEMEEFIEIMEEVSAMIDDCPEILESRKKETSEEEEEDGGGKKAASKAPTKSAPKPAPAKTVSKKPVIQNDEEEEEDNRSDAEKELFGDDDGLDDLSIDELIEFAKDNKLNVLIKAGYPKSKVVHMVRQAVNGKNDLPFDNPAPAGSAATRLANLKNKNKGK